MKKAFETPEIEVQAFEVEDIMTESPAEDELGPGGLPVVP